MKRYYLILLTSALLISCNDNQESPSQVTEKYWRAIQQGDKQTAKEYISTNSIDALDAHIKALENLTIDDFSIKDKSSTVETIINPDAQEPENHRRVQTTLVLENDQWKIDLNNTQVPEPETKAKDMDALADKLSDSMQDNVETIEEMVNEGMGLLNDALHEGSKEMNRTMLEAMKELNEKMQQSVNNMKQRRQKKQQEPENTAPADSGEGLI